MADYIAPKQDPSKLDLPPRLKPSGGGGAGQIILGLVMLVGGIGLSVAGTGRVFIGLIAVGAITLIRGIINASN
jgi:hypothetical protein